VRTGGQQSLVTNPDDPRAQPGGQLANWVLGDVDNTDPDLIRNGLLFPYINSLEVYKCPADKKIAPNGEPTRRSMSMNAWMNPINTEGQLDPRYTIFYKQTSIRRPTETWVTVDENPTSINDGWFLVRPNAPNQWRDVPASYHNDAGGMSFADGHAEIRKWTDRNVLAQSGAFVRRDPNSDDLQWLIDRTTYLR
jgi:prepilin-type processing-associated H-X9-DG protein